MWNSRGFPLLATFSRNKKVVEGGSGNSHITHQYRSRPLPVSVSWRGVGGWVGSGRNLVGRGRNKECLGRKEGRPVCPRILSLFPLPYSLSICTSKKTGADPKRPILTVEVHPRVREPTFPYHEETSIAASLPQDSACALLVQQCWWGICYNWAVNGLF